jgi:hypothetical protein
VIDRLLSYGRGGRAALADEALDERGFRQLLTRSLEGRLTGLLGAALADGNLPVTASQWQDACDAVRTLAEHSIRIERRLLVVHDALSSAGIDMLVLKGPALAHSIYPCPELRPFGDLDLLVAPNDIGRAESVLGAAGYRRTAPSLGAYYNRTFAKGVTFADDLGFECDVHRTFTFGPFTPWIDVDTFWEHTATFTVGNVDVGCLDASASFVHICLNRRLSASKAITARDVAELSCSPSFDIDVVEDLCSRSKLGAAVAQAVMSAAGLVAVADHAMQWAELLTPSRDELRLLAEHDAATGYRARAFAMVRQLPIGARVRFLLAHAPRLSGSRG